MALVRRTLAFRHPRPNPEREHGKEALLRSVFRISGITAVAAAALLGLPLVASANRSEIYASDAYSPSFNVALNDPTNLQSPRRDAVRRLHPRDVRNEHRFPRQFGTLWSEMGG
jgi:hypothetical protein